MNSIIQYGTYSGLSALLDVMGGLEPMNAVKLGAISGAVYMVAEFLGSMASDALGTQSFISKLFSGGIDITEHILTAFITMLIKRNIPGIPYIGNRTLLADFLYCLGLQAATSALVMEEKSLYGSHGAS